MLPILKQDYFSYALYFGHITFIKGYEPTIAYSVFISLITIRKYFPQI